jgi:hypothetical protein
MVVASHTIFINSPQKILTSTNPYAAVATQAGNSVGRYHDPRVVVFFSILVIINLQIKQYSRT